MVKKTITTLHESVRRHLNSEEALTTASLFIFVLFATRLAWRVIRSVQVVVSELADARCDSTMNHKRIDELFCK